MVSTRKQHCNEAARESRRKANDGGLSPTCVIHAWHGATEEVKFYWSLCMVDCWAGTRVVKS